MSRLPLLRPAAPARPVDPPRNPPHDESLLIREVGHAAGNLFHRIQYCTSLLEDQVQDAAAADVLGQLKLSVAALQRLVGRTMELLRPADLRMVSVAVDDVVRSVALRFGLVSEGLQPAEALASTCIDPLALDRAFAALAEVFVADADEPARRAVHVRTRRGECAMVAAVSLRVRKRASAALREYAEVHADVNLALARKLLSEIGCDLSFSGDDTCTLLEFTLPLIGSDVSASGRVSRDKKTVGESTRSLLR